MDAVLTMQPRASRSSGWAAAQARMVPREVDVDHLGEPLHGQLRTAAAG